MSKSSFQDIAKSELIQNNYLITAAHKSGFAKVTPWLLASMWNGRTVNYIEINKLSPTKKGADPLENIDRKLELEKGTPIGGTIYKVTAFFIGWAATIATAGIFYVMVKRAYLRGIEQHQEKGGKLSERKVEIQRPSDELLKIARTLQAEKTDAENKDKLKYPEYLVDTKMINNNDDDFFGFDRNIDPKSFDEYFSDTFFRKGEKDAMLPKEQARYHIFPTISKDLKGKSPADVLMQKVKGTKKKEPKIDLVKGSGAKIQELIIPILDGKQYSIIRVDLTDMSLHLFNPGPKTKDDYNKTEQEVKDLLDEVAAKRFEKLIKANKIDDSEFQFHSSGNKLHGDKDVWKSGFQVLTHALKNGFDGKAKITTSYVSEYVNVYVQSLVETQFDYVVTENDTKKIYNELSPNLIKKPVDKLNSLLKKDLSQVDLSDAKNIFAPVLLFGYKHQIFDKIAKEINFDNSKDEKDKVKINFVVKVLKELKGEMSAAVKGFVEAYDNAPKHNLKLKPNLDKA